MQKREEVQIVCRCRCKGAEVGAEDVHSHWFRGAEVLGMLRCSVGAEVHEQS